MHKVAFALSGGGARGAYIAGAIRYLIQTLPRKLGYTPWPKLVSGASVGTLNGYCLACHSEAEVKQMTRLWINMSIDQVYRLPMGVFTFLQSLNRAAYSGGMLDATPLQQLIKREVSRKTLRYGIHPDRCHAFLAAATHLASGTNTIFADCAFPSLEVPNLPGGRVIRTKISSEHIIASGSVPLLFTPVCIEDEWYLDGGINLYAPLNPLIRMGADRILVLGTRSKEDEAAGPTAISPTISAVTGLTFNAMGLDHIERDLLAVEQTNQLIDWGTEQYGPEFATLLAKEKNLRRTEVLHLRPSRSLSLLAQDVFVANKIDASKTLQWMLAKIHSQSAPGEGSFLLSFLMFDKLYSRAAEDLGYQDTKNRVDELLTFFD